MELTAKKTIKATHRERMADNEFNALFGEVEIDDRYCLNNYMTAEIDFEHIYRKLNLHRKQFARKLTFRVRKIKGNSVAGRYYPSHRTLVVGVNNMDSFIHELGHLMDYEWSGTGKKGDMLNAQEAFKPLYDLYVAHYMQYNTRTHGGKYSVKYYTNPTEVFARCFELYVARKFGDVVINETMEAYKKPYRAGTYPTENVLVLNEIDKYFNTLFNTAV